MSTTHTPRTRDRMTPRDQQEYLGVFEYRTSPTGPWLFHSEIIGSTNYPWTSWERTSDELHGSPPYRVGGPFSKVMCAVSPDGGAQGGVTLYNSAGNFRYRGGFKSTVSDPFYNPSGFMGPGATSSQKASLLPDMSLPVSKAWNGARPKIQQVDGFVALAELGEIPSMLGTSAANFHSAWQAYGGRPNRNWSMPNSLANNWLNHHFGWVPFVSTVNDAVNTYQRSNDIISRLTANNGQSIRRRVTVENLTENKKIAEGFGGIFFPQVFDPSFYTPGVQPKWEVWENLTRVTTGVGKFRYYLPEFDRGRPDYDSAINNAKRHLDIYGVRINPSNLYQAVPWSWAVDWVSNVGQYVQRFSDEWSDNLAAEYFYVTTKQRIVRTYICEFPFLSGSITLRSMKIIDTKRRVNGDSPFGVSLSWDNLSPRQLSIAAALGISNSRPR